MSLDHAAAPRAAAGSGRIGPRRTRFALGPLRPLSTLRPAGAAGLAILLRRPAESFARPAARARHLAGHDPTATLHHLSQPHHAILEFIPREPAIAVAIEPLKRLVHALGTGATFGTRPALRA
jgi:hypothetical protein